LHNPLCICLLCGLGGELKYIYVHFYLLFCMGVKHVSICGVTVDLVFLKMVLSGIFRHKRLEATQSRQLLRSE